MGARFNEYFSVGGTGEIAGSVTAKQCPSVTCKLVKFKAERANAGNVYIGTVAGVAKVGGADSTSVGYELDAGEDTDWLPASNVCEFSIICDNAGDDLVYIYLV